MPTNPFRFGLQFQLDNRATKSPAANREVVLPESGEDESLLEEIDAIAKREPCYSEPNLNRRKAKHRRPEVGGPELPPVDETKPDFTLNQPLLD
jgi:hypothetical protein